MRSAKDLVRTAEDLSHLAFAAVETVEVFTKSGVSSVSVVASDDADITSLFGLAYNGAPVAWPEGDGAVVSDKLLRLAGISVGDSLTVELGDGTVVEIPVTGVFENYVSHYILLTGQGFETYLGKTPAYSTAYAGTEDSYLQCFEQYPIDFTPFTDMFEYSIQCVNNAARPEWKTPVSDTMLKIYAGDLTIDEGLDEIQRIINEASADYYE